MVSSYHHHRPAGGGLICLFQISSNITNLWHQLMNLLGHACGFDADKRPCWWLNWDFSHLVVRPSSDINFDSSQTHEKQVLWQIIQISLCISSCLDGAIFFHIPFRRWHVVLTGHLWKDLCDNAGGQHPKIGNWNKRNSVFFSVENNSMQQVLVMTKMLKLVDNACLW